jgi:hypothetical protein
VRGEFYQRTGAEIWSLANGLGEIRLLTNEYRSSATEFARGRASVTELSAQALDDPADALA